MKLLLMKVMLFTKTNPINSEIMTFIQQRVYQIILNDIFCDQGETQTKSISDKIYIRQTCHTTDIEIGIN